MATWSGACLLSAAAQAATPDSLAQAPLFLVTSAEPLVMLNLSNDHQLFFKAFDDYSNLDDDPGAETTYKHSVDYYGYFDTRFCYSYVGGVFVPQAETADKYCNGVAGDWSGNFLNWATMARMDVLRKMLYGGYRATDTSSSTVLERVFLPTDAHSFVKYLGDPAEASRLTPYNSDISICNTTYATAGNSRDVTAPPLMRVAQGNFSMWTAHEGQQCHWSEEDNTTNNNQVAITEIAADTNPPSRLAAGSAQFNVRVQVCVTGLDAVGNPDCRVYPNGNYKPIGLLQQYGEQGEIQFGLLTGSYDRNKSGGVLRKNVGSFADEVNVGSDGTFTGAAGIVDTLNRLRLTRYDYGSDQYNVLDSCTFGQFGFNDGECSNWGNPQSEIYLESLRYFGGLAPTAAFAADDSAYINGLGSVTWADPLSNANYCAPVNVIQFNASTNSFDGDQVGGFANLPAASSLDTYTDTIGGTEGVTDDGETFVGQIPGANDRSCTPKDLDVLSEASGVCPEAPWLEGTYDIAGMAYYARTESIRSDLSTVGGATAEVQVNTYGVALAPAQPVIEIPVPGGNAGRSQVILLPACMEYRDGGNRHNGNCAIVDFRIVRPHTELNGVGTGKFMVLWESAQAGGDYDQDMGGIISYSIDSTTITVTTQVYGASTGGIHGFGYVISGTTQDGLHIHSGHNNFNEYTDPYGLLDCSDGPGGDCEAGDPATSQQYTLGSTVALQLQTPLYYAAKWGGFREEDDPSNRPAGATAPNDIADQQYEWDANGDGIPDQYFFATDPTELRNALRSVFLGISEQRASAAATAANSQRADIGTFVFQARFDSEHWGGQLIKYSVDETTGALDEHTLEDNASTGWGVAADGADAGVLLDSAVGRRIITYNPNASSGSDDGLPFQWDDLPTSLQAVLGTDPDTASADVRGAQRLAYLRGDRSQELQNGAGVFRNRERLLGDIVSSAPVFVGAPSLGYPDFLEPTGYETYTAFTSRVGGRTPTLWVGANDGMLHGFNANTGVEVLAFVPNGVFANLPLLTSQSYTHRYFVDGSPSVGDVTFSGDQNWHTVLVSGLGGGGQSIFALDVTDPSSFAEANASSIVLWEVAPDGDANLAGDFDELGYTYSRPAIVKNTNGRWVAMFGNGYASESGHALFYVVDIEDGDLISSVTLESSAGGNGLSTVAPVDTNGDEIIDAVYAGDLLGNLWKLIPDPLVTGGWKAAWGSTPLFQTPADLSGYAQPITARPEIGVHPEGLPGVMVYFGTGQFFENGDNLAGTDVQRFYGIWDLWDQGSTSSLSAADYGTAPPTSPSIDIDNLLRQCVTQGDFDDTCVGNAATSTGESLGDFTVRFVSNNAIARWDWRVDFDASADEGSMGWYIDLPELGEKQVTNAILRFGRIIFVTLVPSDHSCSDGGESWLMELDAADGSRLSQPPFDLNNDGVFDMEGDAKEATDGGENTVILTPGGKKSEEGIIQPPTILLSPNNEREYKYSSGSSGNIETTIENPMLMDRGRKSWLQIK